MQNRLPNVVILGGGFGGLYAAKALKKAKAHVTLIDRSNHHLFQPLLYQVATATLSPADVAMPIRHILHANQNTDVILGEIVGIDTNTRHVMLADTTPVPYDYLIVATGATHSYFGHPEWEPLARGLKSIEDATYIRGEVLAAFEYAERSSDEGEKRAWLTFIIVGAGATGTELAGAFSELAHKVLKDEFRHIQPEMAKVVLVEAGPKVLPAYDPGLSERAKHDLLRLKVDVRLDTTVRGIDNQGVETNKSRIEGRTVIWAAGVEASPVATWLGVSADRAGRVKVENDLSLQGHENIYILGDCALSFDEKGNQLPGLGAVAQQQGKYLGKRLTRIINGEPGGRPFHYVDKGILATIGRSRAIGQFGRIKIAGWFAWLGWLFVHILLLVGFRNRLSVLLQWAWSYITWDRGARLITPSEWARMRPQDSPTKKT